MTPAARLLAAAALSALAMPAWAHTGVTPHVHGIMAGVAHPLGGLDHVLAMVAVGLWAGLVGGRASWAWPAAFVAAMVVAAGAGLTGFELPMAEIAIAASVFALGLAVALGLRAPVVVGAAVCGLFAVAHGWAHGAEMPADAAGLAYGVGFVAATVALHAVGLALAGLSLRHLPVWAARIAGGTVALAGVALLGA